MSCHSPAPMKATDLLRQDRPRQLGCPWGLSEKRHASRYRGRTGDLFRERRRVNTAGFKNCSSCRTCSRKESDMPSLGGKRRCVLASFIFVLVMGGASFAQAADESSPVASPEQSPPTSGEVQDRGLIRGQFGGTMTTPVRPIDPTGFSCDPKTKTCSCRKSTTNDCDLMKGQVCKAGTFDCKGSSQSCTCDALK